MFEKKTWVNRQSEHPARRRLTPTGNDNEYDVARAEGVIMEENEPHEFFANPKCERLQSFLAKVL